MSVLDKTAHRLGEKGEAANIRLAGELAEKEDTAGIRELVVGLDSEYKALRHDCIKVLYEIGKIKPGLIGEYTGIFLEKLLDKNNRMVWGAMIALSTVAAKEPDRIFDDLDLIYRTMETGAVITNDAGVRVLAGVAASKVEYRKEIFPVLLRHLRKCRSKDIPQHAESIMIAVGEEERGELSALLRERMEELSCSQRKRVEHLLNTLGKEV